MSDALAILPILVLCGLMRTVETVCGTNDAGVHANDRDRKNTCASTILYGIPLLLAICCIASSVLMFVNQHTGFMVSGVFLGSILLLAIIGHLNPVEVNT